MIRLSSTLHWPWIGRVELDIGMRMYIVAKPWKMELEVDGDDVEAIGPVLPDAIEHLD